MLRRLKTQEVECRNTCNIHIKIQEGSTIQIRQTIYFMCYQWQYTLWRGPVELLTFLFTLDCFFVWNLIFFCTKFLKLYNLCLIIFWETQESSTHSEVSKWTKILANVDIQRITTGFFFLIDDNTPKILAIS